MKRLFIAVSLITLARSPNALGDCDRAAQDGAKHRYVSGDKAFRLGDFDRAISEFRASYELCPVSLTLYNIGQAFRLKGDNQQALFFYRQFVASANPKNEQSEIDIAKKKIKELEQVTAKAREQHSQPTAASVDEARAHYKRGFAAYGLQHYAEAAKEYESAFQLEPDPALLFNAAQAHRMSGNRPRAIELYRSYVRLFGDRIDNRQDVERLIATLEAQPASTAPPEQPSPPPQATPAARITATAASSTTEQVRSEASTHRPWWRRGWVWGTIGGVVAIGVAVGVGVGVGAGGQSKDPSPTIGGVRF